jgi:hypothetical protein
MPWVALTTGCLAGIAFLAVVALIASSGHSLLSPGTIRVGFLPAVAGLAFVPRTRIRPLTQTTPVPGWVVPAGHILLATPMLAVTGWAQLRIIASTIPPGAITHPVVYPVIAELTGWCAVAVAAAACTDRSRYADLGGAVAAPVSFAAIALARYAPITSRFLTQPSATPHGVTIAWYAIGTTALILSCVAMRDQWHRYTRSRRRLRSPSHCPAPSPGGA